LLFEPNFISFLSRAHVLRAVLASGGIVPPSQNTQKPMVAASRLSSFQSQTRTGTVAGRLPDYAGKANSVSPFPARIAL
jgi:hypothetical protein